MTFYAVAGVPLAPCAVAAPATEFSNQSITWVQKFFFYFYKESAYLFKNNNRKHFKDLP
jgi:hypothetical protein